MTVMAKCEFNDDLILYSGKKRFSIYPVKDSKKKFSVFYDISDDIYRGDTLYSHPEIQRGTQATYVINVAKSGQKVLEVFVDCLKFDAKDTVKIGETWNKTIHNIGKYELKVYAKLIEAVYKYKDYSQHKVFVNPEKNIYEINQWLCDNLTPKNQYSERCITPKDGDNLAPKNQCTEFCITIKDAIIDESQSFLSLSSVGPVTLQVAEKCFVEPITADDTAIVVPWSVKPDNIIKHCSEKLSIDISKIVLLDKEGRTLNDVLELNICDFRNIDSRDPPRLFYDIPDAKTTINSLKATNDPLEIMITKPTSVLEIKKSLAYKKNVEYRRFIICRGEKLLSNDEVVSTDDPLLYCLGSSPKDVKRNEKIDSGSFGTVYKCTSPTSPNYFALKELKIDRNDSKHSSIVREMLVCISTSSHKGTGEGDRFSCKVVQYLDFYIDDNKISISMEYISGGTLYTMLNRNGPLEEFEIRRLTKDIVEGVKYLHSKDIVHRDIKSPNVLLDEHGDAKLSDFGLSKILSDFSTKELSSGVDQTIETGSFRWMAPEVLSPVADSKAKYGLKVDIWSVGATVVEMITGKVPHCELSNEYSVVFYVNDKKKIDYVAPNPISNDLIQFVEACLTPEGKDRPNVDKVLSLPFLRNQMLV